MSKTRRVLRMTQDAKGASFHFFTIKILGSQRRKNIWSECSVRRRTLRRPWNARYEPAAWTPARCSSSSPVHRSSGAAARAPATRDRRRDGSHLETRLSLPRVKRVTTSGLSSEVVNKSEKKCGSSNVSYLTLFAVEFVLLRERRLQHGVRRRRRRTGQAPVSMPHRERSLCGRADPRISTEFPDTGSRLAAGCR